jgi:GTP-binding protein
MVLAHPWGEAVKFTRTTESLVPIPTTISIAEQWQRYFRRASFSLSTPDRALVPGHSQAEVAFAGRSNSGKSSAINVLVEQTGLARVSKTPGRTQHLVFFGLDQNRFLVDLPGYGFAAVSKALKDTWSRLVEGYLLERECLQGLVLMMDIRHPLTDFDQQMLDWAATRRLPLLVLLTKADKLNRGPGLVIQKRVKSTLEARGLLADVQLFSALKKTGVDEVRVWVAEQLGLVAMM